MSPDRATGLLHAMPFVGLPLRQLLNLDSVPRSGGGGGFLPQTVPVHLELGCPVRFTRRFPAAECAGASLPPLVREAPPKTPCEARPGRALKPLGKRRTVVLSGRIIYDLLGSWKSERQSTIAWTLHAGPPAFLSGPRLLHAPRSYCIPKLFTACSNVAMPSNLR